MQNGIEGCFPQKIIPHTLRRRALSDQASSGRFLFSAEHYKCGRAGKLNIKVRVNKGPSAGHDLWHSDQATVDIIPHEAGTGYKN